VLEVLCRVAAPLLPLTTEAVYRDLTGARSVHLTDWPDAASLPADPGLVEAMDRVRNVCSAALSLRKAHGRRVRLPLAELVVATDDTEALAPFVDLIANEVNVKSVVLSADVGAVATEELQVVPAALGPRLGSRTQEVIRAVKAGDWQVDGDQVVAGGISLQPGEFNLRLVAAGDAPSAPLERGAGVVVLDVEVTPELEAEGLARDLVRLVQQARRDAGLAVSDRISLTLGVPEHLRRVVEPHAAFVAAETLATSLTWGLPGEPTTELDGTPVSIQIGRA
jgi:isoleucyl-tRNA synthetase